MNSRSIFILFSDRKSIEAMPSTTNQGQTKRAFVIGNQNYEMKPLRTAVKDATDMTNALEHIGFQVTLGINCNFKDMSHLRDVVMKDLSEQDLFLFYFAGHGIQLGEVNYLVPIQAIENIRATKETERDDHIRNNCLRAQDLLDDFSKKVPYVIIFILDCCRDNPIGTFHGGSAKSGLVSMQASGISTLIQFACAAHTVADDGNDATGNSLFTRHLLKYLTKPNKSIDDIFNAVTRDVQIASNGMQVPTQTRCMMIEGSIFLNTDDRRQHCKWFLFLARFICKLF